MLFWVNFRVVLIKEMALSGFDLRSFSLVLHFVGLGCSRIGAEPMLQGEVIQHSWRERDGKRRRQMRNEQPGCSDTGREEHTELPWSHLYQAPPTLPRLLLAACPGSQLHGDLWVGFPGLLRGAPQGIWPIWLGSWCRDKECFIFFPHSLVPWVNDGQKQDPTDPSLHLFFHGQRTSSWEMPCEIKSQELQTQTYGWQPVLAPFVCPSIDQ